MICLAALLLTQPFEIPLQPLISREEIALKIDETAHQIDRDYADRDLTILMVLKGSIFIVSDLMRALSIPCTLEVVQCKSYGERGSHRGELQIIGLESLRLDHRDVLIVDDIFDSGQTMASLVAALQAKGARSVKSLVLLYKKDASHVTSLRPDYRLFDIENRFVVGYGLDFKEYFRNLPGIFIMEESR